MKLVLAAVIGISAAAWTWGAITGRLASMLAAAIDPAWVGVAGTSTSSAASLPGQTGGTVQAPGTSTAGGRG